MGGGWGWGGARHFICLGLLSDTGLALQPWIFFVVSVEKVVLNTRPRLSSETSVSFSVVRVGVFVLVGFDCVKSLVGTDCVHMLCSNEAWHRLLRSSSSFYRRISLQRSSSFPLWFGLGGKDDNKTAVQLFHCLSDCSLLVLGYIYFFL